MKKLMFTAVAMAAGVLLAEGITSQNIVGYAQNGLRGGGSTGVGSQFFAISGEGINISDIVVNSSDIYSIALQTLSMGGETLDQYSWNDWTEYPAESGEYPGFWEKNWSGEPAEFVIKPGDGIWMQAASDTDTIQTAGQVGQSDIIIPAWTGSGNKLVANSFPVPVPINDLLFTTTDMYSISVQTLTSGGETIDQYTWNDWTEYPAESGEYPGFWEKNWSGEPAEFSIQPGEAVWIQGSTGDTLRIPAPEI